MFGTIIARKGRPERRRTVGMVCAILLSALAAPAKADPADGAGPYAVHHTGLTCARPPCFGYCARSLATGEERRFSRLVLPPGYERLLEDPRPAIVLGGFYPVDGGARRGLELRVSRVVGRAVEPARPGSCPL